MSLSGLTDWECDMDSYIILFLLDCSYIECTISLFSLARKLDRSAFTDLIITTLCFSLCSQKEGRLALLEQSELYTSNSDPNQDMLNPHKDRNFLSRLTDTTHTCHPDEGAAPIIRSLQSVDVSDSVIDGVLQGREMGLDILPGKVKRVLHHNQADAFKAKVRKMMDEGTWGKPDTPPDTPSLVTPTNTTSPVPEGTVSPALTLVSSLSSNVSSDVTTSSLSSEATTSLSNSGGFVMPSLPPTGHALPTVAPPLQTPSLPTTTTVSVGGESAGPPAAGMTQFQDTDPNLIPMFDPGTTVDAAAAAATGRALTLSPAQAVASVFGSTSTDSIPTFTAALQDNTNSPSTAAVDNPIPSEFSPPAAHQLPPFQQPQQPPLQSEELNHILEEMDSIPDLQEQCYTGDDDDDDNGDQILEELLMNAADVINSPSSDEIRYYDEAGTTSTTTPTTGLCYITSDVTVSTMHHGNLANAGKGKQLRNQDQSVMNSGVVGNSDVLDILSQFS